jgi:LuxR family transcriptional regulator, maltose regulon positive regulatory protein
VSRLTPQVNEGFLVDPLNHLKIRLGSADWFAWLKDVSNHTFHFTHASGGFTARKERKQRGDHYWIAYRQFHNKLHKVYIGKSETLTEAHLADASATLAEHIEHSEES